MSKYDSLRYLLGTGTLDWVSSPVVVSVVDNYNFDATDATVSDIQLSGAKFLANATINNKSVSSDGWAVGSSVLFTSVQSGGPYDLVISVDTNGLPNGSKLLVHYNNAVTVAANGDVIVDPDGGGAGATGNWFRF